jgi:hypothetical protein
VKSSVTAKRACAIEFEYPVLGEPKHHDTLRGSIDISQTKEMVSVESLEVAVWLHAFEFCSHLLVPIDVAQRSAT